MAKPEWGVKRLCTGCAVRFYDLMKTPPICPSCGAEVQLEGAAKAKKPRAAEVKAAAEKKPVVAEVIDEGDEVEVEDDDFDDGVLLDDEEEDDDPTIVGIADVEKEEDAST